jgi:hypothetical protein
VTTTSPANFAVWSVEVQRALIDDGIPCGLNGKPDTAPGQPWILLSVMSTVHDGDIAYFDTDQDTLVQVRCVGYSPEQAAAVYWRADAAVTQVTDFPGGKVIQRWRDNLFGPSRDDRTFPNATVYDVTATFRLWLAPTEE